MLITNATILTWDSDDRILHDYAIYIEGGMIRAIGPTEVMIPHYRDAPTLDARGQYAMPGSINAHTHLYRSLGRALIPEGPPPAHYGQINARLWWPLARALDADAVRLGAQLGLIDAIRSGTTALIDHHASPNALPDSLGEIAKIVEQAGVRAALSLEVSERDQPERVKAAIEENARFIAASRGYPRITGFFGLDSAHLLSDRTLYTCADLAPAGAGYHLHAAESETDQEDSLRQHKKRIVHRLRDHGLLGDRTLVAGAIHLNDEEMNMLQTTGAWICHLPRASMIYGLGALRFDAMAKVGLKLCLGDDGLGGGVWQDWKAAHWMHKLVSRDPRAANPAHIVRTGLRNNARFIERLFPGIRLGQVSEGAQADLILVDYQAVTPLDAHNLAWHILAGFESGQVTTTIVAGQVLMHDRQLLTLDEEAILAQARRALPGIWARYAAEAARG